MKNLYIKKLNFYWRLKENFIDKNIVPDFLPFETDFDTALQLVIQKRNDKVLKALDKVYKEEANIGNIQEGSNWNNSYGQDFLDFIDKVIAADENSPTIGGNLLTTNNKKSIKKILEIGCGSPILLENLQKRGLEVAGIDPAIHAVKDGKKRGIKVIQDFFPSDKLKEKFDLIFHSDVIEHVNDPIIFLKSQSKYLNPFGFIIVSTPDYTDSIKNGDMSLFLHQHLNFFDKESLKSVIQAGGFINIWIEKAKFGNALYALAQKAGKISNYINISKEISTKKYRDFLKKNTKLKSKVVNYINRILVNKNKNLGLYAPVRAFPYLALLKKNQRIRLFDDTSHWYKKYFDGINIPIENFEDLKKQPVTDLLIMTPTFGNVIEEKIVNHFGKKINIRKITDFFTGL